MGSFKFEMLDPRPTSAAAEANDLIFALNEVFGVEVTVPALAARCTLGNIDPQHTGGDASRAAIEEALAVELPPEGAVLATVRADLDAVGAMAVLEIRDRYESLKRAGKAPEAGLPEEWRLKKGGFYARVAAIAAADKFAHGRWPGPRPLPTRENPWPDARAHELAAIGLVAADHKIPLAQRVEVVGLWLETGTAPGEYQAKGEAERLAMIEALEKGEIVVEPAAQGAIAVVRSAHRAAMEVGYASATVVVAENPNFRQGPGPAYRKLTVAQYASGHLDLKAVLAELAELEPGWGGSPTIGGSPQGVSSKLTIDEVVAVVEKHLR